MATAVRSNDRERMADDLKALGLYATANLVRAGKISPTHGVEHVRHYVLSDVLGMARSQEAHEKQYPPIPGTFGAIALIGIRQRLDQLQGFLGDWAAYDLPTADQEVA
jgi:hypothetical protein